MSADHDHVQLLVGYRNDGSPSLEMTPARHIEGHDFMILGTPGLANGCAAGDRVRIDASGAFVVVEHGPNVAVHLYSAVPIPEADLLMLRSAFADLSGAVEWPVEPRFVVVTVPVDAGFPEIEAIVGSWVADHPNVEWNYGNVYDSDGRPLGWWE